MTKNGKESPSRQEESNPGAMRTESPKEPSIEDVVRQKLLKEFLQKFGDQPVVSLHEALEALSPEFSNTQKTVPEAGATGGSCSGVYLVEHENKHTDGVDVPAFESKKSPVSLSDSEDEEYSRQKVVVDNISKSTKLQKKRPVKLSVGEVEAPASKKSAGDKVVVRPVKSSIARKRSVSALESDDEEHVTRRGTADDQAVSSAKFFKPRKRIVPPAISEDEYASQRYVEDKGAHSVKPTKLRRKSAKDSGSETEESARKRGVGEDQLLPTLSKSRRSLVKSSESEGEENSSKRSRLKDYHNPSDLSSNNNTKSHSFTPISKKQLSPKVGGPKQKSITLSSQIKVGSDCYPESKRGKKTSSDAITGKSSLNKTTKNYPDECKQVKGKLTPSTKPVPADPLARKTMSQKLNESPSPSKKSKKSLPLEHNSTKSLPEQKETSPKVQPKVSASEELLGSSIEKAKKLKEVEENPASKSFASAADPQTKKSLNGKLALSLKRNNQKRHGRDENVTKPYPEGHIHQLIRDESEKDEDLKLDELSDSPTFSVSCSQPPLVKTQKDLEHDNIAIIEEFDKTKPSPIKRKLSALGPSPSKSYVVKGIKGDETITIPEDFDIDIISKMECRVNLELLGPDKLAKHVPPSTCLNAVEQFKELKVGTEITSEEKLCVTSGTSNIIKEDVFVKPTHPAKHVPPSTCLNAVEQFKELKVGTEITSEEKLCVTSGTSNIIKEDVFVKPTHPSIVSSKSKIRSRSPALNVKSSNVTKRTGKPQTLFNPIESRAQRNPIKVSARDVQVAPPDLFADWHKQKNTNIDPLDKLKNEENELDYEADNDNDEDDMISFFADTTWCQNLEEARVSEETLVQRQSHNSDEDCRASCGSDDSRGLSDMDVDNSDHSDAQEEPNDSNKLDQNISAPQKENVLGIPVEDYSASKIDQHKRHSVESGELVDDDDSDSIPDPDQTGNAENVTCEKHISPSFLQKVSGTLQYDNKDNTTDSLNLSKQKNTKESIQDRLCEGDEAVQESSTDMNQSPKRSELLQLTSARGSSVLQPDQRVNRNFAGVKCKTIPAKRSSCSEAIKTYPSVPVKNNPEVSTVTPVLSHSGDNSKFSNMPSPGGRRSKLTSAGARKSFETQRSIASSTSSRTTTTIPNKLQPVDMEGEGDAWISKLDIPIPAGVHFDTPKRGLLPTPETPYGPSTALFKTPDHELHNAAPSTSSAMPIIEKASRLAARKASTEGPTPLSNNTREDQKVSKFRQSIQNNANTIESQRSIPVSSTNLKSPLGIEPIQQQGHHYVQSLKDTDLRPRDVDHRFYLHQADDDQRSNSRQQDAVFRSNSRQQDADFKSNSRHRKEDERSDLRTNDNEERSLMDPVAADLLDDALMLYCSQYLTVGECSNVENCNKLHQFPELVLDENQKHKLSVTLIRKMLLCFPFWRKNKFLSSVETLGSYNRELSLCLLARSYWNHCCECNNLKKTEVDYYYWNQLAQGLSKCGFKQALCARKLLKTVLYYNKKPLSRQLYHVIDNIVDTLFPDFIEGCSDLWFGLSVLSKLEDYEIPANLMREILRDTLTDSRNTTEHGEICDYLLKGSTILECRKPEDWEFLHFIHQFLFVLQQSPCNLPRAQKLAKHFNLRVKNPCPCCVEYATKIEATEVVEVPRQRFTLSRPLSPIISSRSGEYLNNYQPKTPKPGVDDGLTKLALHPTSHVLSNDLPNVEITRSSQGTFVSQSTSSYLLNSTNEGEVTSSTEVICPTLLTSNDHENMCTEETSGNIIETTTTTNMFPQALNKYSGLVIVAEGDKRCVKSKASEPEPPHQNSNVPANPLNIRNAEDNPPVSKVLQSTKEESKSSARHPVADLIKAGKCGKAAKYISTWKNIRDKRDIGIRVIVETLMEMDSGTRIKTFQSLLQAIAAHMNGTGTADNQLKAIMVPIGLSLLENFLRGNHNLEAKEVHDVLWTKMSPLSVQLESHSPSYLELITAWVHVKNNKVKEALDIMTSNNFCDICGKWAIRANPSDTDLRDQVCSVILNHCEELDSYAVHAEKLFRNMLSAKGSYNIDVTQFYDDILRALVKASHVQEALSLCVWAHNTHNIKPLRSSTHRLLLTQTCSLPDNVKYSPELIHILNQEPYDQALPVSVEGLSRVNVCLQSVWSTNEVHAIIFGVLLHCHLCNLNQDIPDIGVEIKECPLPTPAPGEKLFPSDLLNINPSVPAMQERVLSVVQPLLNQNNSRFENGILELDRPAVSAYVTERQRGIDSNRRPRQRSSDRPINTGRKRGDMHCYPNRPHPSVVHNQWGSWPVGVHNQWQSHNQPSSSRGHYPNYHNFEGYPGTESSADSSYPKNGYDTYRSHSGYQQGNRGYPRFGYHQNRN